MCYEVTRWFGVCSSLVLGRFDSKSGLLVVWMKSTEFPLLACLPGEGERVGVVRS